jgi:hypothetical protein
MSMKRYLVAKGTILTETPHDDKEKEFSELS